MAKAGGSARGAVGHDPLPGGGESHKLTLSGVVMVIYFTVAGGAFGLEPMVGASAPGVSLFLILAVPFIWSMPIVLMVMELSTAIPVQGGFYVWVRRGLGPFWAFIQAWTNWLYGLVIAASFAAMFADYTSSFLTMAFGETLLDTNGFAHWLVAAALITVMTLINLRGAKSVGDSGKLFAAMVLLPFAVMCVIALFKWTGNPTPFWRPIHPAGTSFFGAMGIGLFIVLYNYLGWDGISTVLGEIDNPLKVIPRAMAIVVPLVVAAYFLPVLAGLTAGLPYQQWGLGEGKMNFPLIARAIGGNWLGIWLAVGGMFCAAGLFNAIMLVNTRLPSIFAADHYFPAALVKPHPRYHTPVLSILLCALIYAALAIGPFETLAVATVILYGTSLTLQFLALIALRIREPGLARPFRIPGGLPALVIITLLPTGLIIMGIVNSVQQEGMGFIWPSLLLLASAPVAFLITSAMFKRGRPNATEAELNAIAED